MKTCSDYKTRFCCRKQESSSWGPWKPWSQCTKSCGGGTQFSTRKCNEKGKDTCFGNWKDEVKGQDQNMKYKKRIRDCNVKDCASNNFAFVHKFLLTKYFSRFQIPTLGGMDSMLSFLRQRNAKAQTRLQCSCQQWHTLSRYARKYEIV